MINGKEPMSNEEYIKAMSHEELAEFLMIGVDGNMSLECCCESCCPDYQDRRCTDERCLAAMGRWLKLPVEKWMIELWGAKQ